MQVPVGGRGEWEVEGRGKLTVGGPSSLTDGRHGRAVLGPVLDGGQGRVPQAAMEWGWSPDVLHR